MLSLERLRSIFLEPKELAAERDNLLGAQDKATRTGQKVKVRVNKETYRVEDKGRAGRQVVLVRPSGTSQSTD